MDTNDADTLARVARAFKRVFAGREPVRCPFGAHVRDISVIFPTNGLWLHRRQFMPVQHAARAMGEADAFLVDVEVDDFPAKARCAMLDPFGWPAYSRQRPLLVLENAVVSGGGRWGVMVSQFDFGIIGGGRQFMEHYWEARGGPASDLPAMQAALRTGVDRDEAWAYSELVSSLTRRA